MTHYMILTAEAEDADPEIEFSCSGVTSGCECWMECDKCTPTEEQAHDLEGISHGVFHKYVSEYWSTATGRCGLYECDVELGDIYYRIYDSQYGSKDIPKLASGKYKIHIDDWDEGTVYISLAS